jgi:hypothetical protein
MSTNPLVPPGLSEPVPEIPNHFTIEDIRPIMDLLPKPHHSNTKYTADMCVDILNAIATCGVLYRAAAACGGTFVGWRWNTENVPELKKLEEKAMDIYRERLSLAIHNRAVDGWLEPVYFQGNLAGYRRQFSDRLLELHAKRHMPEYRDKHEVDMNVKGGVLVVPAAPISTDQWLAEAKRNELHSEGQGHYLPAAGELCISVDQPSDHGEHVECLPETTQPEHNPDT